MYYRMLWTGIGLLFSTFLVSQSASPIGLPDDVRAVLEDSTKTAKEKTNFAIKISNIHPIPVTLTYADALAQQPSLVKDSISYTMLTVLRAAVYDYIGNPLGDVLYEQIDSLLEVVELAPDQLMRVQYAKLRRIHQRGQYGTSIKLAQEGYQNAVAQNDTVQMGMFQNYEGLAAQALGRYQDAIDIFEANVPISEAVGDYEGTVIFLQNLSMTYDQAGRYLEALEASERAETVAKENEMYSSMGNTLSNRAALYKSLSNRDLAVENYRKAISIYRDNENYPALARNWSNLATVLSDQPKTFDQAVMLSDSAIGLARQLGNPYLLYSQYDNRCYLMYKSKDYTSALAYSDSAYQIQQQEGFPHLTIAPIRRVKILWALDRQADAWAVYEQENINGQKLERSYQPEWYEVEAELLKWRGESERAYQIMYMAYNLRDSVYNEAAEKRMAGIVLNNQLREEQQQRERTEYELTASKEKSQQRLILAILGTLAAGMFLFLLLFIRRRNRQLERLNADVRNLNRELNHRTGSQLDLAYNLLSEQVHELDATDERTRTVLERSQTQLHVIAGVNRLLKGSEDAYLNVRDSLKIVVDQLCHLGPPDLTVEFRTADQMLSGETVVRLALVVSELMHNSFKYAFENVDVPRIEITGNVEEERYVLTYRDNGPGKSDVVQGTGHGTGLIYDLLGKVRVDYEELAGAGFAAQMVCKGENLKANRVFSNAIMMEPELQ